MGKTADADLPPYRDDPSQDDALSLHTTQGEEPDNEDIPEFNPDRTLAVPPPYSDNEVEEPTFAENPLSAEPEGVIWRAKTGKLTVSNPAYDKNPKYLFSCANKWAKTPPAIHVRILGTHTETVKSGKGDKKEKKTVTDFDMKIRLTEYLFTHSNHSEWKAFVLPENQDKAFRGGVLKSTVPKRPGDLEYAAPLLINWCEDYCDNKATLKR
jgi:hypothetical protein